MAGRQLAPDLPEFLQVMVYGAFRGLDAEGRVTAGAADAGHAIALLEGGILAEELLETAEAAVDGRLRQFVVPDHRESIAFETAREVRDERSRVPRRELVADRFDRVGHVQRNAARILSSFAEPGQSREYGTAFNDSSAVPC